jgi:hypothetical protein
MLDVRSRFQVCSLQVDCVEVKLTIPGFVSRWFQVGGEGPVDQPIFGLSVGLRSLRSAREEVRRWDRGLLLRSPGSPAEPLR